MRSSGLDILRILAVFFVLCRHAVVPALGEYPLAHRVCAALGQGGWVGVDLFFVLSGFLVSGLLFKEYRRNGTLNVSRFLIRRGFKIYPAFWILIALTVVHHLVFLGSSSIHLRGLLGELFFCQNYVGAMWNHTWSLAVEEHFYFGLAGLMGCLVGNSRRDRMDWIPKVFWLVAAVCLALRGMSWIWWPRFSFPEHLFQTHLRLDSLFFGVWISYFYHLKPLALSMLSWRTSVLVPWGGALLLPAFVFPVELHPWISVVGVVLFFVGSGFWVIASLRFSQVKTVWLRGLARLGAASYSIYLWHMPVNLWGWSFVSKLLGTSDWYVYLAWYLGGSCAVGYLGFLLIERPMLRLRDLWFGSGRTRST